MSFEELHSLTGPGGPLPPRRPGGRVPSAVADRFGLWGPAGTPGVAWGSFDPFLAYTGKLLWYLPAGLVAVAGWAATVLEVLLAVGLLVGVRLWAVALASGALLLAFAVAMTVALGPEPPLSYSVWAAAAGAFLLASIQPLGVAQTPNILRIAVRGAEPAILGSRSRERLWRGGGG